MSDETQSQAEGSDHTDSETQQEQLDRQAGEWQDKVDEVNERGEVPDITKEEDWRKMDKPGGGSSW